MAVEVEEQVELLVEEVVVVGEVVAEQGEGLGVGAAPGGDLGAAAGDEVDGGEVLEHLHGVGGGEHGHGAGEPDAFGGLRDGGEQDGRRRDGEVGSVVLTDAEHVEVGLVGEYGEVDELAQPHGGVDRAAGRRVGGDLAEGEQPDLERTVGGHGDASSVRLRAPSQRCSSASTAVLMPCPPGSRTPVVALPAVSWR